jgi:hypothetical protein
MDGSKCVGKTPRRTSALAHAPILATIWCEFLPSPQWRPPSPSPARQSSSTFFGVKALATPGAAFAADVRTAKGGLILGSFTAPAALVFVSLGRFG